MYTVKYYSIMFCFRCMNILFWSTLVSPKSKDKLFWKATKHRNLVRIFEACWSSGITYYADSWYHMLNISLKRTLCLCIVYRHVYNLSAFEHYHVFMAWNLDPDSDKHALPWFPGLSIITGTRLVHARVEFSQSHPVLPCLYIFCVDPRVHAISRRKGLYRE